MIDLFTYFVYVSLLLSVYAFTYVGSKLKTYSTEIRVGENNKLTVFHLAALILISFIVGFRQNVGTDWSNYVMLFKITELYPSLGFADQRLEPGYFYLSKLTIFLGGGYHLLFFAVAFISWFFIFKSISFRVLPFLLFFLFTDEYFFSSMNLVRQFVAISLFVFSVRYIINRELLKFIFCILFAVLFHSSAIILLLFYFIPYSKLYNQRAWLVIFLVSFFLSNTPFLITGFIDAFVAVASHVPLLERYISYFVNEKFEASRMEIGFGYLFRTIVSIYIIVRSQSVLKKHPQLKVYFVLFFIGAIVYNLFYMYPLVTRLNHYLTIMRALSLAIIIFHDIKLKGRNYIAIGFIILYFILYLTMIGQGVSDTAPYEFDVI